MNSQKSRLIVTATVILWVAFGLSIAETPVLKIKGKTIPDVYLQSLDIQVEVTGNIASTRYTMVFKNKTYRTLEGELTFPLPDGRTVTYYALDINGKMREAVPVEKARGTEIFEEIEQRQVDPGLLERVEGNNFRTRIYPIPANGVRTIAIGYEEELSLEDDLLRYRLPMAYPDKIENFTVKATVWKNSLKPIVPDSATELIFDRADENYVAAFTRKNYRPTRMLNFALPVPTDIPQVMMQPAQGSYYFFASVAPKLKTHKKHWADDLAIIWDVSLSGSQRDLKRETEILDIIFAEKKHANVHLYFLNNTLTKMNNKGTANGEYRVRNGKWDGLKDILEKAVFDGGTDFSKINLNTIAGKEILFFSDGISTLSDVDFIQNTPAKRPIHCLVSSVNADYSAMRLIAGKTNGKFININALSSAQLKNELLNETPQFLRAIYGKELREVYPSIALPIHGNFSLSGIAEKDDAEVTLLFGFGNRVEKRIKIKLDAKNAGKHRYAHKLWAQKKIAELDLNYDKNRDELMNIGQQFGIVTRNTSLIVLETIDDYIHYKITPPAELREEYLAEYMSEEKSFEEEQEDEPNDMEPLRLKRTVKAAKKIKKWWNKDFALKKSANRESGGASHRHKAARGYSAAYGSGFAESSGGGGINHLFEDSSPTITVKPIRSDNDYLKKLTGKIAEDYQLYLKLRDDYGNSPTFYFDIADWFYTRNDKKLAILVLTSIADLELENASLYRLLGYRFKEYGEYALEKFVCRKVVRWRPMEPQSYRDYALALADNGEEQAALDSLYELLTKQYSEDVENREGGSGMEKVVIMEMNRLIAKNVKLNTSKIDKRLIINTPVDIRVVINWNMNNTDIDLLVHDPNDEDCYYGNRKTEIGGRLNADVKGGYGPEQFVLKKAMPGKYQVYVNYFGDTKVTEDGPATVMAEIYTKYAGKDEKRRIVCLQLSKVKKETDDDYIDVAEFEF